MSQGLVRILGRHRGVNLMLGRERVVGLKLKGVQLGKRSAGLLHTKAATMSNEGRSERGLGRDTSLESKKLSSELVNEYWEGLVNESFEEYRRRLRMSGRNSQEQIEDVYIRDLLNNALRTRRQKTGDLFPKLMIKRICDYYFSVDFDKRMAFFEELSRNFGVNEEDVEVSARSFSGAMGKGDERSLLRAEDKLRQALLPLYSHLFLQINQQKYGMRMLLDMRKDVLEMCRENTVSPSIRALNENLKGLLADWFSVGQLDLVNITWDSSASLIEKLMAYEAVHKIADWEDIKYRLNPNRRCFSFFHRTLPNEPLVILHVALVKDMSDNIQGIIEKRAKEVQPNEDMETAIFYSISSTQPGLSGIELGNFLIKRAVKELQKEFPNLKTFSTLSPIPKFRSWLRLHLTAEKFPISEAFLSGLCQWQNENETTLDTFVRLLETKLSDHDEVTQNALKEPLTRLCAYYLLKEKKRKMAFDPVANFHIRNGACLWRLNWMANVADNGLDQSFGMMVNYNYILDEIEMNNQLYLLDGTISIGEQLRQFAE
eukprot:Nk52_evm75s215 gene=Nk52_evmTU75s215